MPKRKSSMTSHYQYMARLKRRRVRSSARKKITVSKVKKIAQKVLNKNLEFNRIYNSIGSTAINNPTAGHVLFDGPVVPTGDEVFSRGGNEINLKHLKFLCRLKYQSEMTKIRFILVRYSSGAGVTPALSTVLQFTGVNIQVSPWLKDSPYKYKVLYNKTHTLGTSALMSNYLKTKQFEIIHKCGAAGTKITYENSGTQVPDKMRYVLYALPDRVPSSAADIPLFDATVDTGYTDP